MQVSHEWRVFVGRRVVERGMDSVPAIFTTLQTHGFYWLMQFIVALEQAKMLETEHPQGHPWRFVFRLDYSQPRWGRQSRLRAVRLVILPQLNRAQIPSMKLDAQSPISIEFLNWYLQVRA